MLDKIHETILYFVNSDIRIHTCKLNKLIYFAELYSIQHYNKRILDVRYHKYKIGPYSPEIEQECRRLDGKELTIERIHKGRDDIFFLTSKGKTKYKLLKKNDVEAINFTIDKWKDVKLNEIIAFLYKTIPFQETEPDSLIKLDKYVDTYKRYSLSEILEPITDQELNNLIEQVY